LTGSRGGRRKGKIPKKLAVVWLGARGGGPNTVHVLKSDRVRRGLFTTTGGREKHGKKHKEAQSGALPALHTTVCGRQCRRLRSTNSLGVQRTPKGKRADVGLVSLLAKDRKKS